MTGICSSHSGTVNICRIIMLDLCSGPPRAQSLPVRTSRHTNCGCASAKGRVRGDMGCSAAFLSRRIQLCGLLCR